MILYTTGFYNAKRMSELHFCLHKNAEVKDIKRIHLFIDCELNHYSCVQLPKLMVHKLDHRPTYADLITAANNDPSDITLIANSDVYFDNSVSLLNNLNMKNKFMALSRWEMRDIETLITNPHGTQDGWGFLSPFRTRTASCNFPFGAPGCDNRIVSIAEEAKYKIFNPCLDVRLRHIHSTSSSYTVPTVEGPYGWSWPCRIEGDHLAACT